MSTPYDGSRRPGPYGTNLGDIWLAPGSYIQNRLDAEGEGLKLVHEVMAKDGEVQECLYVTKDEEILEMAQAGHERYVAELAGQN